MLTLTLALAQSLSEPGLVLDGLDPVALVNGQKIKGENAYTTQYLRYRYAFASAENLTEFKKNREKYAVQNGGACGSMGPLSGKGSPSRFEVVEGKIFLFASESCRNSVLANPKAYVAELPQPPKATEILTEKARLLYKICRNAHGLSDSGEIPSVQWEFHTPYEQKGQKLVFKERFTILDDSTYGYWWGDEIQPSFYLRSNNNFREGNLSEFFDMAQSEQRQLRAKFLQHPAGILRLALSDIIAPLPNDKEVKAGFIFSSQGVTGEVTIHPNTRRISKLAFTDYVGGKIQRASITFNEYKQKSNFWLPNQMISKREGSDNETLKNVGLYVVNPVKPVFFGK